MSLGWGGSGEAITSPSPRSSRGEGRGEGLPPQIPKEDVRGNARQDLKNNEPVEGRISDSVIRRYGRRVGGLRLRLNPPYGLQYQRVRRDPDHAGSNQAFRAGRRRHHQHCHCRRFVDLADEFARHAVARALFSTAVHHSESPIVIPTVLKRAEQNAHRG